CGWRCSRDASTRAPKLDPGWGLDHHREAKWARVPRGPKFVPARSRAVAGDSTFSLLHPTPGTSCGPGYYVVSSGRPRAPGACTKDLSLEPDSKGSFVPPQTSFVWPTWRGL